MSRLDAATARLGVALESLDRLVRPLVEARAQSAAQDAKTAELLREREVLLARLAELEEEARSLTSMNEEIETRLDSAIGEIRGALGR
jgi:predicted phage-related endonuclease